MPKNDILAELHKFIDIKFSRKDRSKVIDPNMLKIKLTMYSLVEYFGNLGISPEYLAREFRLLALNESIVTNIDDFGIHPFDAYFVPKTELKISDENMIIYNEINKILHK